MSIILHLCTVKCYSIGKGIGEVASFGVELATPGDDMPNACTSYTVPDVKNGRAAHAISLLSTRAVIQDHSP